MKSEINWYWITLFLIGILSLYVPPYYIGDAFAILHWCFWFALVREYKQGNLPYLKPDEYK